MKPLDNTLDLLHQPFQPSNDQTQMCMPVKNKNWMFFKDPIMQF
uniref:Uncharacterized protein n=1 Tax=uncultured Desulfobacterium sp. TaxID=201089 RepID=E1YIN3_9BACT|nr:unknown protein [uncultured Desulfobacterium sp.]